MYPKQLNNLIASVGRLYLIVKLTLPATGEYAAIATNLKTILDRLNLLQFVHEYPTIAVCGRQGVGKTALMRTLYDLAPDLVPESLGRDERTPIRIIEHLSGNLEAWELRTDAENGKMVSKQIDLRELGTRARGKDDAFAFELRVPKRHFKGLTASPQTRRAWLLLPGREDTAEEWDRRTIAATKLADTCLLVSNHSCIAGKEHQRFIEQLKAHFGSQPLAVAITGADQSGDRNQDAAKKMQQLLDVPPELVVSTDASHAGDRDWIEKLCVAVEHSLTARKPIDARLDELDDLIAHDLGDAIEQIEQYLSNQAMKRSICESMEIDPVLEAWDVEIEAFRRELRKHLHEAFQGSQHGQIQEWLKHVSGVKWYNNLGSILFSSTVEQRISFQQKLESLWRDSNISAATQQAFNTALRNRYQIIAKVGAEDAAALLPSLEKVGLKSAGAAFQGFEPQRLFQEDDWKNIDYLNGKKDAYPTPSLHKMIQHLPLLVVAAALIRHQIDEAMAAAAAASSSSSTPGAVAAVPASQPAKELNESLTSAEVIKAVGQVSSLYGDLVKALGVLAPAGGSAEAKLDAPGRIAAALQRTPPAPSPAPTAPASPSTAGPVATGAIAIAALHGAPAAAPTAVAGVGAAAPTATSAATSTAATTAVPAAAGIGGAALAGAVFAAALGLIVTAGFTYRQIVREEYKLGEWGSLALQSWSAAAEAAVLERFNDNMLRVRERLSEVLLTRHGLDQQLGQRQRLVAAKASCKQSLKELRSEIHRR